MSTKIVIALFAIVSFTLGWNNLDTHKNVFISDAAGYYAYNPALFIYQDLEKFSFLSQPDSSEKWMFHELPNGNRLNKYTAGVAFVTSPTFLVAHGIARISNHFPADGYSFPYQIAVIIASIGATVFGLNQLRKFLSDFFKTTTVTITILCIAFGTNLFYYTAYEPGMGHAYSFALLSACLYLTNKWYHQQQPRYFYLLALVCALIVLVRPVDAIFLIVPIAWGVYSWNSFEVRIRFLTQVIREFPLVLIVFALPFLIQMLYWYYVSGQWLVYSYRNEYFNFQNSRVLDGLFSFRKGWFVYTPLAFLASIGFYFFWRQYRRLTPVLLLVMCLSIYITFSWWMWWYGGSFGCRPLVGYFSIMSLPLAALVEQVIGGRSRVFRMTAASVAVFLIALNFFQQFQYSRNIIHWDRMTASYYFKVWGKTQINYEAYERFLIPERIYWDEINSISRKESAGEVRVQDLE